MHPKKYVVNHRCMSLSTYYLGYGRHLTRLHHFQTAVVVTVVCTRPQAIPLAMITMIKSTPGFPFLSYTSLRLAVLQAAGAPLLREGLQ